MTEAIKSAPRLLLQQELKPVQTDRFQPTGFADLGAAVYERADGTRMLLVESAQSVANRLEAAILEGGMGPEAMPELQGLLPYVRVQLEGASTAVTTSLVEAHRLNSPFVIKNKEFEKAFVDKSGYGGSAGILNWPKMAQAVFYFDPSALLHGLFMANLGDGRFRMARALTGFVEAESIREAVSGGVKNSTLDPSGKIRVPGFDENVYGNVPYSRTEYTAGHIRASFNLDLALLRGYGLPEQSLDCLVHLALLKIRRFLNQGLRLRTACDLQGVGELLVRPEIAIPSESELLAVLKIDLEACKDLGLVNPSPVFELKTKTIESKKAKTPKDEDAGGDGE